MKIQAQSQAYFRFYLDEAEKESPAGQALITDLKAAIRHGDRYWIREAKCWAIRIKCLDDFLEVLFSYIYRTVKSNQKELF